MKEPQTSYTDRNHDSRDKYNLIETDSQPLSSTMKKRIGSTTYLVSVYFSGTSRETVNEKLLRLAKSEVARV